MAFSYTPLLLAGAYGFLEKLHLLPKSVELKAIENLKRSLGIMKVDRITFSRINGRILFAPLPPAS